jgi:hypothetical protein
MLELLTATEELFVIDCTELLEVDELVVVCGAEPPDFAFNAM